MTNPFVSRRLLREAIDNAAVFGSVITVFVFLLAALLVKETVLARRIGVSFVIALAGVLLIKALYFRERPEKLPHRIYLERVVASSFPSMHTINSVILAVHLGMRLPALAPLLLALVVLTLAQRVIAKRHYLSDLLGGLLVGSAAAWAGVAL